MLQSIRALPESNNIKLRIESKESPKRPPKKTHFIEEVREIDTPIRNNRDLQVS